MSTTREVAAAIVRRFTIFKTVGDSLIDAIDKALQAERERCAKTAETHGDTYLDCDGGRDCWKQIAAAIREGKPLE